VETTKQQINEAEGSYKVYLAINLTGQQLSKICLRYAPQLKIYLYITKMC